MQSNFDQIFNLSDVFYFILKRWRNILLFGLIGAVLLGGITFFKSNVMTTSTDADEESVDLESAIEKLTDKEKEEINKDILEYDNEAIQFSSRLDYLKNRRRKLNEQIANSLYLSMANTEQFFYDFDINIGINSIGNMNETEIDEILYNFKVAYNNQFSTESFFKYVESQTNGMVPKDQVKDLIKIGLSSDANIHITVTAPEDVMPSLTEAIKLYIKTEAENVVFFPYSVVTNIINEVDSIDSNNEVQNQLVKINKEITALSIEIEQYKIKLQDRIKEVEPDFSEKFIEDKLEQETISLDQSENKLSKKSLFRNIFLGLFLGTFLNIIWHIYRLITSKNIFDVSSLSDNFGLTTINHIYILDEKNASKMDKWINTRYLKGKKCTSISLDDQVSYTKTMIELLMKNENLDLTKTESHKIGMVSELTDDQSIEFIKNVKDNDFYSVSELSLSLNSEAELKKMDEVNSIVLIIRTNYTKVNEVLYFIEMAKKMNKKILGVISIECL